MRDAPQWPAPIGRLLTLTGSIAACLLLSGVSAVAQQVQVTGPMTGVSDSFSERFGTSWGFRGGGAFFNFGGPNPGLPPFGGHDLGADARFGLGGRWGGGAFSLQGFAGQGSSRTIISDSPTVVIPNGGVGTISNTLQRPFVTGLVPVVGRRSISPLLERLERLRQQPPPARTPTLSQRGAGDAAGSVAADAADGDGAESLSFGPPADETDRSTARHGDLGVAEIRRRREAEQRADRAERRAEVEQLIERGRGCEAAGKLGAASIYYKQAARRAESPLREQLLEHARQLQP